MHSFGRKCLANHHRRADSNLPVRAPPVVAELVVPTVRPASDHLETPAAKVARPLEVTPVKAAENSLVLPIGVTQRARVLSEPRTPDDLLPAKEFKVPVGGGASVNMPEWVKHAIEAIDQPQEFLSLVVAKMCPQAQDILFHLPPVRQIMVCRALILNPVHWRDVGRGVFELNCLLDCLSTGVEAMASVETEPVNVHLVVFHNCSGILTSLFVLKMAMKIVERIMPSVQFHITSMYSFEIDSACLQVQQELCDIMREDVEMVGDISKLPGLIRDNKKQWDADVKLLFMNSPPCRNTSVANPFTDRPDGSGFHMSHSRAIWPIIEAQFNACLPEFDCKSVFHMTEFPKCGNAGEEAVMNTHFGTSVELRTDYYRAATRTRAMRTNPINLSYQYCGTAINPFSPIDGWVWKGNPGQDSHMLEGCFPQVTLRSHIVKLVQQHVFEKSSLKESELKTLNTLKMKHPNDDKEHFVNRQFWYLWLGVRGTPIQTALDNVWPCIPWIIPSLGIKSEMQSVGEPCGASRYCHNCEKVMTMLGQGWHAPIMIDVAVALLTKIGERAMGHGSDADLMDVKIDDVHVCGPGCPRNPRQGS